MSKVSTCPACGGAMGPYDQTCQKCGEPLSYAADETGAGCSVCGAEISAYTETCPSCGEIGYPALRPRKGKGFKGAPEADGSSGA
ncbi:MAG: zinc ribbon domain-containing protein [Gemmatimonadota bacterium]